MRPLFICFDNEPLVLKWIFHFLRSGIPAVLPVHFSRLMCIYKKSTDMELVV